MSAGARRGNCIVASGADESTGHRDQYRRTFDVVAGAFLALITLPILTGALLGSAIALRTWPLFSQTRIGRGGEPFRFVKVRTLPRSVPNYIDKHQLDSTGIPRFCRLLRALHLDELPQLYLVLIGRMSLVGPRPEMERLHEQMPLAFATRRTSIRPGCTGLWQVSESCTDLIGASPEYDLHYLANRSLRLDLWLLYRTALKMSRLAGCISLAQVPTWTIPRSTITDVHALDFPVDTAADTTTASASAGRNRTRLVGSDPGVGG